MAVKIINRKGEVEACPPEVPVHEYRSLYEAQRRIVRNWFEQYHKATGLEFQGIATRGRTAVIFFYRDPTLDRRDPANLRAWEVTHDPQADSLTVLNTCEALQLCVQLNAYRAEGGRNTWDDVIAHAPAVDWEATNNCRRLAAAVVYMNDGSRAFYCPFREVWEVERWPD